ncbi:MAG: tetratricopeptide repeat protein, partial [Pirellulales bacterium]|nr:tetratricopeptide repeat protein [Pirellulales bacterium]
ETPPLPPPVRRRFWGLNRRVWAGTALIVVLTAIVYLPSVTSGFILDDDKLITDNETIRNDDGIPRIWFSAEPLDYWPVTNTMLWIEWRLWGMHPAGYHVVNLVLHVIATLLIWRILNQLSIPGAFLAAVLFAVHPVNVESVAWIAQRKDALAIVFFLLSILWYLKAEKPIEGRKSKVEGREQRSDFRLSTFDPRPSTFDLRWYWLSLAAFLLAMLSKGSVAPLPAILLGITWWRRKLTWGDLWRTLPFFVIAAVLAAVNVWFQHYHGGKAFRDAGPVERVLDSGVVVWFYLYKAILPIHLRFVYPLRDIPTGNLLWWLPLAAGLAVTAVLWWYRNGWGRPFLFAWGFFCVSLIPVMGLTDVGFMEHALVADHYQHIAIIGVIALAAAGWATFLFRRQKTAACAAAILVVGVLSLLSWRQNERYRDPIALYRDTLEYTPNCWLLRNNLGILLSNAADREADSGDKEAAARHRKEAAENYRRTIVLNPEFAEAYNNLANILGKLGRPGEALPHYEKALYHYLGGLHDKPDSITHRKCAAQVQNNIGYTLVQLNRLPEAIKCYEGAIALMPNLVLIHNNLADALAQAGRWEEAVRRYQASLKIMPANPEIHAKLAFALFQSGRAEQACAQLETSLRLFPNEPGLHNELGSILGARGQHRQAVEHFQQAIRLKRDFLQAYLNLVEAYSALGRTPEAVATAHKALKIARDIGQTAVAEKIERWLILQQAPPPEIPQVTPADESAIPRPY